MTRCKTYESIIRHRLFGGVLLDLGCCATAVSDVPCCCVSNTSNFCSLRAFSHPQHQRRVTRPVYSVMMRDWPVSYSRILSGANGLDVRGHPTGQQQRSPRWTMVLIGWIDVHSSISPKNRSRRALSCSPEW
jgi:hypothetical protein